MSPLTIYRLICGVYWLFLGVWVGGLVMLAIAAAVTFKTVREYQPTLTAAPYNQPELAKNGPEILAGGIVGNVLKALAKLQAVCAAAVIFCVVVQCLFFAERLAGGPLGWGNLLRLSLVIVPVAVLVVDQVVVTPKIWSLRQQMYDPAVGEPRRQQAKADFDYYHHLDENIVKLALLSLVAVVVISAFVLDGQAPAVLAAGPP